MKSLQKIILWLAFQLGIFNLEITHNVNLSQSLAIHTIQITVTK